MYQRSRAMDTLFMFIQNPIGQILSYLALFFGIMLHVFCVGNCSVFVGNKFSGIITSTIVLTVFFFFAAVIPIFFIFAITEHLAWKYNLRYLLILLT